MKVIRKEVFEFVVVFGEREFIKIRDICNRTVETPEQVVEQMVAIGYQEKTSG